MAKSPPRKPAQTKAKTKARKTRAPVTPQLIMPSDVLSLLTSLQAFEESLQNGTDNEDLDRAQELAFDAMEISDRGQREVLARQALAISPLCTDAYAILAEDAATLDEKLSLYRQAVAAGEEALGQEAFVRDAGAFWGLIETRPYMRARHALALTLAETGERDEAISHYQDLLRLNPSDNQGIRYCLIDVLLASGRDEDAADLIKRFRRDDMAAWQWSKALLAFRQKGDGPVARRALAHAVSANAHVTDYLLGKEPLPDDLPDYVGMGDATEAASYVTSANAAWTATAGAREWLALRTNKDLPHPRKDADKVPPDAGLFDDIDEDRVDDATLALLLLGRHSGIRAWKGFDWEVMDRLYAKGMIDNPVGKAKSVTFTQEGLQTAERLFRTLFAKPAPR